MKIRFSVPFPALAAVVGFAAGWICRPAAAPRSAESSAAPAPGSAVSAVTGETPDPIAIGKSADPVTAQIADDLKTYRNLSDAEFAQRLADAWMTPGDPKSLLQKALLVAALDSGRAKAFYNEFKRRKGIAAGEEGGQDLREFLTMAGKKHGRELVAKLLEEHPEGPPDMDSLLHGWVTSEPTQAVEWLNALPEDAPHYSDSLKGIVWGLGETSPAYATDVFLKLPEEERDEKLYWSLSSSIVKEHGIAGLNQALDRMPEEGDGREQLLVHGMQSAMGRPPSEFVEGLAARLSLASGIEGVFQTMAGRWVEAAPSDVITWLETNGADAGGEQKGTALRLVASRLSRAGHGEVVNQWLAANPNAPGGAAIQAGLRMTPR